MSDKDCTNDCTLPLRFPRRPGTEQAAAHSDTCSCGCNSAGRISQDNRPALSRFNYRIGTYGSIREFLFHQLDKTPELQNWTHRAPDDPAVALMEGAAILGDILTFYQETYANEAYLRTAQWRESIADLVRLLGYRLSPAVGGNAVFAFELKKDEPVTIPVGFPVKATLEELPKPAEFETTEEITAYPWLNRFNLFKPLTSPDITPSTTEFYISVPEQLTDPVELKAGDRLVIGSLDVILAWPDLHNVRFGSSQIVIIDSIREQHGQKIYKIKGSLKPGTNASFLTAYKLGRSFHHFGYNSPASIVDTSRPVTSTATVTAATATTPARTDTSSTIPTVTVPLKRQLANASGSSSLTTVTPAINDKDFPLDSEVPDLANLPFMIKGDFYEADVFKVSGTCISTLESIKSVTLKWGNVSGTVSQLRLINKLDAYFPGSYSIDITTALFQEIASPAMTINAVRPETTVSKGSTLNFYGTADQVKDLNNRRVMLEYPDGEPKVLTVSVPAAAETPTDDFPKLRPVVLSEEVNYSDFKNDEPTVTVFGNLANANEGKTQPETPIGSGDATQAFQNFKLPKAPLTYHIVPENTPSETPEIEIYVDGRLWKQVDSFFGRGKDEQIYIVREDAEGNSWVQFGDGKTGARLNNGFNNVNVRFRIGDGAYGPLKEDTKVQASAKLKNLDKIGMPMDATGGAPAEDGENARNAAPGKVQSLGRIVSLKDFESEALAIPGVASASAAWQLVDNVPAVVITVLMETGRSTEIEAVRETLDAYNRERGAARHSISVVLGKRMYVRLAIEYALKPTYRADLVEPAIRRALGVNYAKADRDEDQTGLFSMRRRKFGAREYASSAEGWTQNVEGVLWARAVTFQTLSNTQPLIVAQAQILAQIAVQQSLLAVAIATSQTAQILQRQAQIVALNQQLTQLRQLQALMESDDPDAIPMPSVGVMLPVIECGGLHILSLYDKHLTLTAVMEEGS